MASIDRDYTYETTLAISKEMDKYFGEDGELGWIGTKFYEWHLYDISGKAADSYKKYIKSKGATRDDVERNIKKVLRAVERVEKEKCREYEALNNKFKSYKRIVDNLSECISLKGFSDSFNFDTLHKACYKDKCVFIEYQVEEIIEKNPSEWTDGDIEVLSYVYINSNDKEEKERIINAFYYESTDKHIKYEDVVYSQNEIIDHCERIKYYDRYEKQWEKFVVSSRYYASAVYKKHLNGDNSSPVETTTRNLLEIEFLNDEKFSTTISSDDKVVKYGKDNKISLSAAVYSEVIVKGETPYVNGKRATYISLLGEKETYSVDAVMFDQDAENYIEEKADGDTIQVKQVSGDDILNFILDKTLGETAGLIDTYVPGLGIALEKGISYGLEYIPKDEAKIETYEYIDMKDYVRYFDLGVVETSNGIQFIFSNESEHRIKSWMELLEKKYEKYGENYESAYKKYVEGKTINSYINGEVDITQFVDYVKEVADDDIRNHFN